MKHSKGMWLDGKPSQNPEGSTRINKNILKTDSLGAITNEKGFTLIDGVQRTVVGVINIPDSSFVLFTITNGGSSEIGIVNKYGKYRKVTDLFCFAFNTLYPIHGEFYINNKNETVIAWTDNFNPPRTLNLNTEDADVTCENTLLFNHAVAPKIESSVITTGGSLQSGSWIPFVQLERLDGSVSNIFKMYNPINIVKDNYGNYTDFDGNSPQDYTTKAIALNITGIDLSYAYIHIGFLETRDGVLTAKYYTKENITSSFLDVTITGQELKTSIDLAEFSIDYAIYKTIRHLTQVQKELFAAELGNYVEPNMQEEVNTYTVEWLSKLEEVKTESTFKNNVERTFAHGEVYAFYIRFHWQWGIGRWHVLQGREGTNFEKTPITLANGETFLRYQIKDTCSVITTSGGVTRGRMSFWENRNEVYPDNCGFNGGNVRHFKFPSLAWCKANLYTQDSYGVSTMDRLGIKVNGINLAALVDCNGDIPYGYEIGFARRDFNNSTTSGQSIIIFHTEKDRGYELNQRVSMGGNWNITQVDNTGLDASHKPRVYPFEYLHSGINPTFNGLRLEYRLQKKAMEGFFLTNDLGSGKNDKSYFLKADFTDSVNAKSVGITEDYQTVKDTQIVPFNTISNDVDNLLTEACVTFEFDDMPFVTPLHTDLPTRYLQNILIRNEGSQEITTDVANTAYDSNAYYETFLVTLLNVIKNCYSKFNQQTIVSLSNSSMNTIWGGDIFICDYSFNTYGRLTNRVNSKDYNDITSGSDDTSKFDGIYGGIKAVHRFICESQYNIGLRYENVNELNGYTRYFPKSAFIDYYNTYLKDFRKDLEPNLFKSGYSKDFNSLNVYQVSEILTPEVFNNFIQKELFSIIRSKGEASNKNFWRNFKQGDKFTGATNRGKISNLQGGLNFLYIHYEEALYKTIPKNRQLQTSTELIYLGTSDIFASEPEEILHTKLGQLGTKHKFSCLLCPLGYVFYDVDKGAWFIVADNVKVISDLGLRTFFKDNKECYGDNPYNGYAMQAAYDERYDRLLLTRKFKQLKQQDMSRFAGLWKEADSFFKRTLGLGDIVFKEGRYRRVTDSSLPSTAPSTTAPTTTTVAPTTTVPTSTTTVATTTTIAPTTSTTQATTTQPPSNLQRVDNIFIGNPTIYQSDADIFDSILNVFSRVSNTLQTVYTTNGINIGSVVFKDTLGTQLLGTGYIAFFDSNSILKKVGVVNGVITTASSTVSASALSTPSNTRILAPFKHYQSGIYVGTGYGIYDNGGNLLFWASKLEIANDGLTITDSAWNNYNPAYTKYWKFNKEAVSNSPLVNYTIPAHYKGCTVEIQIVQIDPTNADNVNSFSYTIQVAE
jgi:hypothetical protein